MSTQTPQQAEQPLSSRWILDFEKQVVRGKHVLLYGNVLDQFLWRGAYMTPLDFMQAYFREKQFALIGHYDSVDGLRFADPSMHNVFEGLVRQSVAPGGPEPSQAGDMPAPAPSAPSEPANPLQPPPRRRADAPPARPSPRVPPDEMFARLRRTLAQNEVPCVFFVELADMLTQDAQHYDVNERTALVQLKKCSLEASLIRQGPLTGYRNMLVIVAGDLNRVPEWLYRENPFMSIVQAARPNKDERSRFVMGFGRHFYGGEKVSDFSEIAEDFANLTVGFQAWDLEALRRTSWAERIGITESRRLIDFFKFGLREDPWERLSHSRVSEAETILSRRVIGQPHAIHAVTTMLTTARIGLNFSGVKGNSSQPKGVFFFVGPTGVGKTELAKAVTELVFSDDRAFERFDMSEYKEEHAAEKLTGAPPGFVGYDEGGRLTNRVIERPHSILLFDEIEKAHPKVLDKFLQILEDGRLTDGKGQTAYFNQTAIIFTSNIGASELMERAHSRGLSEIDSAEVQEHFRACVQDYFVRQIGRAELLNRLGENVIAFDMLRPEYVQPIGEKFLALMASGALEKYGLRLQFLPSIWTHITARMTERDNLLLGGRRVKTLLQTCILEPTSRWIFENEPEPTRLRDLTLQLGLSPTGALEVTRG